MVNNNLLFFQFFFILTFSIPEAYSYELNTFNEIESLTRNCLHHSTPSHCRQAINLVHELQRHSEKAKNYPCQTRLLGLEANIIMSMNESKKINKTHQILKQVKTLCK